MNEALAGDLELSQAAAAADRAAGHDELARARELLLEATTQTVLAAAGAEQPAVAARWWVAVPYLPRIEDPREQLQRTRGPLARADAVVSAPRGGRRQRPRARPDRGGAARRGNRDLPARRDADARAAVGAASPRRPTKTATCVAPRRMPGRGRDHGRAGTQRTPPDHQRVLPGRRVRDRRRRGSPAGCVTPTGRSRRSCTSDPRPRTPTHRGSRICCAARLPATLAVHISVGGRAREQARQRRRWKRLRAAVLYKERRDRLVGSDEQEALEEAAVVDAELAAEIGASVYRVGIYCSIRDPHGRLEQFNGRSSRPPSSSTRSRTPA